MMSTVIVKIVSTWYDNHQCVAEVDQVFGRRCVRASGHGPRQMFCKQHANLAIKYGFTEIK